MTQLRHRRFHDCIHLGKTSTTTAAVQLHRDVAATAALTKRYVNSHQVIAFRLYDLTLLRGTGLNDIVADRGSDERRPTNLHCEQYMRTPAVVLAISW